jgi:nicotinamidase-related amidase
MNACVDSTARSAADREYKCILIDDATAGVLQLLQEATIQNFGGVVQSRGRQTLKKHSTRLFTYQPQALYG